MFARYVGCETFHQVRRSDGQTTAGQTDEKDGLQWNHMQLTWTNALFNEYIFTISNFFIRSTL